jgi:hypothetical protein
MKITEKEFNIVTGKETITERDLTDNEITEREKLAADRAALNAETEAKAAQKAAVFTKLGLTADEVAALLS